MNEANEDTSFMKLILRLEITVCFLFSWRPKSLLSPEPCCMSALSFVEMPIDQWSEKPVTLSVFHLLTVSQVSLGRGITWLVKRRTGSLFAVPDMVLSSSDFNTWLLFFGKCLLRNKPIWAIERKTVKQYKTEKVEVLNKSENSKLMMTRAHNVWIWKQKFSWHHVGCR